ncbi:glycosyltransferase family 2 protein [Verrucosispora sp. WMMC514]|uniref:glycosyltransferase family 2 protein n=1 Tax=Verrucosispora sp. WMMC514 TaxID=3015156 RepID=UPI00248B6783|nr:glycosyltransferase family 2 protein [Verrucosispora sp. WMMC514]WBB92666.1 glycosyltransferase family 2 protein [Verrucosispora sp. WMMC514]
MTAGALKVSVVVPTYNPGECLDRLVASLLRQSLPTSDFEVIFVDDGSTDATPARLDALAAAHPHFHVLHAQHSGWPSRPRNLGVTRAKGEYVQFVDDDDWLADEALARLSGYAAENEADVAIGRIAGHGRSVPRELFRVNRPDARLADAPLMESLTCHKMFRRAFLLQHELRFPEEGRKRLEDHHLVTRAYLLSRRTCVLADYTCYHHSRRPGGDNLTAARMEPEDYFRSLREVLDIVEAHTEPGPLRDRLHQRWLRIEMLRRLRGDRLRTAPRDWVDQVVTEARRTIRERFAPGVAAGLPALERTIAGLVERGRVEDLFRIAEWETGVVAKVRLKTYELTGHTLDVTVSGRLRSGDRPVSYDRTPDGRELLDLPVEEVPADLLDCSDELLAATDELRRPRLDVVARRVVDGDEFYLPVSFDVDRVPHRWGGLRLMWRGRASIDFRTLDGGRTQGDWILKARLTGSGCEVDATLPLAVSCAADGARPVVLDTRQPPPRPAPPPVRTGPWQRLKRAVRRGLSRGPGRSVRSS